MNNLYTWNFWIGTASERATFEPDTVGARFFTTDTQKLAVWTGAGWVEIGPGAAGPHTHPESDIINLITDLASKEPANSNIQTHVTSQHAPTNAQKNSDILKAEIEARLTGVISTHSHAGGGAGGYAINVQALTSSPVDAQTVYFGMMPKAPITTANISKVYVRAAGTITRAEIYCYSGTAGTNQAWSLYVRKNNTTLGLSASAAIRRVDKLTVPPAAVKLDM